MKLTRKKGLAALGVVVAVAALVAVQAIWRPFGGWGGHGAKNALTLHAHTVALDIQYPDAIIDSVALSRLPRDIIRVPLLQTLLTRDFVDYYEATPTRLSAEGALRRLAFEHDLDWRDELVKRVFDEPSRVLLWRSPDGRLGYWLMSMRRNGLARVLQGIGNVAASDSQLSQSATLPDGTPVYALKLATGHTLLFAAKGERLVILSEPGILLDAQNKPIEARASAIVRMLNGRNDDALRAYGLDRGSNGDSDGPAGEIRGHRVVVSANYLSFGYQTFFSGINALRFDFAASGDGNGSGDKSAGKNRPANVAGGASGADGTGGANGTNGTSGTNGPGDTNGVSSANGAGGTSGTNGVNSAGGEWQTAALIDPARLPQHWDSTGLWRALPANAAACASLPVDWHAAADLLDKLGGPYAQAAPIVRARFAGPAAVCWYAKSTLVAPVFVAHLAPPGQAAGGAGAGAQAQASSAQQVQQAQQTQQARRASQARQAQQASQAQPSSQTQQAQQIQQAQQAQQQAALKQALAVVFDNAIGAYEARAASHPGNGADGNASNGDDDNGASRGYLRLPVKTMEPAPGVVLWQRPVSARAGTAVDTGTPLGAQLSTPRYFPVTLALAHDYVVFSPDERLVGDTLAVLDKRYPAMADTLAPQRLATTVVALTPATAAALIEREAGRALPADQEAIFRNAARTHLLPKLQAVAHYPPVSLSLPDTLPKSVGWVPVQWHFDTPRAGSADSTGSAATTNAPGGSTDAPGLDQPGVDGD